MLHSLALKIAAGLIALATLIIGHAQPTQLFGNYNPSGGGTYRLNASVGTSDSTLTLSSFKEPVSNIPFTMSYINTDVIYGTLDPQTSHSEFVSVTGITQNGDGTATLTGLSRGLSRTPGSGGCVASSTLAQSHPGQSIFIMSNPPCQLAEYLPLRTTSTSSAVVIFGSTTIPRLDVDPGASYWNTASANSLVSLAQLNRTALAGTVNASEAVNGVVELATQLEMASSTNLGGTSASLVLQSRYATSSPGSAGLWAVITNNAGRVDSSFLNNPNQVFTFSGGLVSSASTTIFANATSKLTLNALSYVFPTTRGASSTVLSEDGNGNLSWGIPFNKVLYLNSQAAAGTSAVSTTTLVLVTLPANTFAANTSLRVTAQWNSAGASGACEPDISYGNGSATTSVMATQQNNNSSWQVNLSATATTSAGELFVGTILSANSAGAVTNLPGYSLVSTYLAASSKTYLAFGAKTTDGVPVCKFSGGTVELLSI